MVCCRLSQVSTELHKTWGLVGRLQAQHQQLHTHEKILRYELHQKRELLTELKQELEYCREKWESAREKNSQTDREWRLLRREFAARKARDATRLDDLNNSGESGLGEDSGEDDIDSSGRSESPSVTEDPPGLALSPTSTHSEEDLVTAASDLPDDPPPSTATDPAVECIAAEPSTSSPSHSEPSPALPDPTPPDPTASDPSPPDPTASVPTSSDPTAPDSSPVEVPAQASADDAVPIQVVPLLEQTEQDGELLSLELSPVAVVTTSACVVTTEPLPPCTVVRSAAVVLETTVVPSARNHQRTPHLEDVSEASVSDSDASSHKDFGKDLKDLKVRALITYTQRVASLRAQQPLQDAPLQDASLQDALLQDASLQDAPLQDVLLQVTPLQDAEEDALVDSHPITPLGTAQDTPPDSPQDTALRPPPTRVVPLFGALAALAPQSLARPDATATNLLFSTFDVNALDFSISDVSASLKSSAAPAETPQESGDLSAGTREYCSHSP